MSAPRSIGYGLRAWLLADATLAGLVNAVTVTQLPPGSSLPALVLHIFPEDPWHVQGGMVAPTRQARLQCDAVAARHVEAQAIIDAVVDRGRAAAMSSVDVDGTTFVLHHVLDLMQYADWRERAQGSEAGAVLITLESRVTYHIQEAS